MAAGISNFRLAHELDAAWLLALYLAIHGGDPPPEEGGLVAQGVQHAAALNAIMALSEALDEKAKQAVQQAIAPMQHQMQMHTVEPKVATVRLKQLGIHLTHQSEGEEARGHVHTLIQPDVPPESTPRFYCFRFRGETICVQLPSLQPRIKE